MMLIKDLPEIIGLSRNRIDVKIREMKIEKMHIKLEESKKPFSAISDSDVQRLIDGKKKHKYSDWTLASDLAEQMGMTTHELSFYANSCGVRAKQCKVVEKDKRKKRYSPYATKVIMGDIIPEERILQPKIKNTPTNREMGYYMTIQDVEMVECFQRCV